MTPRVALFTDCYHDVNGVALTCRQLSAFAQRHGFPLLKVHAGPKDCFTREGEVETLELKRTPVALRVESDLSFDFLLMRHLSRAMAALREFRADVVHITAPGDFSILGALAAHRLGIPIAASWHTNLHEFAARRLEHMLAWIPPAASRTARWAERFVLDRVLWFYSLPRIVFAPNRELIDILASRTGRPVYPMHRGVDTDLFSPDHRTRNDDNFVIGFAGRLRPEKNVRLLAELERALTCSGYTRYRFLICGDGSERAWLQSNLRAADCVGVLRGPELSRAYANMDLFVFPSRTDTYGNVVQEAMASGVPAVVTSEGGPKYLVRHEESGFIAKDDREFIEYVLRAIRDREGHSLMRLRARRHALAASWNSVFEAVWNGYRDLLESRAPARDFVKQPYFLAKQ